MRDRRTFLIGSATAIAALTLPAAVSRLSAADRGRRLQMVIRKNPGCMCCNQWAEHLGGHGIETRIEEHPDLAAYKAAVGVPENLGSCHTGTIEGYLVEGHVPGPDVLRMLEERPAIKGIAVAGMPMGSPGMEAGDRIDPYEVIAFGGAEGPYTFARHG
jgi:hypothetical protein